MTQLPRLIRGQVGPIAFHDMNEVFRHVERDSIEEVDEAVEDQEQHRDPFFLRVEALEFHSTAPYRRIIHWVELSLNDELRLEPFENGRDSLGLDDSGNPSDFAHPAIVLMPPFGIGHVIAMKSGPARYVFQPSPTTFTSKVTAVIGGPLNAKYDVLSVGGIIEQFDMTPIKRWSGLDYEALSVGATCWLNATGVEGELELLALEKPVITDCNAPSPAGFGDSFIGF